MKTKQNKTKFDFKKFETSKIENLISINGGDGDDEDEDKRPRQIIIQGSQG
ncbi:hypothetical protein [Tenacibaculum aquimarinum]|uniref:hypothetical protein n=1 Tax=Tenacibaculum aquimarinum TaxID=2910675 RepID=UPI001F0A0EFB|nr:hypothetical protein [Tenacibaculum aquimarinum]MCH3883478.1 hypothetical protein [Tenacibaculum aquimarinum]